MASWDDSDDDWEAAPLPALAVDDAPAAAPAANDDEGDWTSTVAAPAPAPVPAAVASPPKDDKPLILVNFTKLSSGAIHNRFDPNACNDPVAKSALSKKILVEYDRYANDAALIASGDVRPCGASCWQAALAALRVERPGQYFAPVFPPATR